MHERILAQEIEAIGVRSENLLFETAELHESLKRILQKHLYSKVESLSEFFLQGGSDVVKYKAQSSSGNQRFARVFSKDSRCMHKCRLFL